MEEQRVTLAPVSRANVRAVCELRVADHQRHLVGPAAYTVAEGNYEPGALLRVILRGEAPVGVLLAEVDGGTPYLVRFMVDAAWQGHGVGRHAVELLAAELLDAGEEALETSFVPAPGGAGRFWKRCGFQDTGRTRHGEPLLVLALSGTGRDG